MGSTCIRSASKAVSPTHSAAAATGHHQLSSTERDGVEGESSYVSCDESKRRNRSTSVSFSEVAIRIINGEKSSSVDEQGDGGGSPHEESLTSSTVAVVGGDDDEMGANQSADVHFLKNLTALHPDAQLVANGQAEVVPVSLENSSTSSLTAGTTKGSSRRLLPSHHKRIHPPLSSEGAQRCSEESDMDTISDSMWIAVHRQVDCLEEQQGGGDGESSLSSGQLIVFAFDDDTCGSTGAYRVN